MKFVVEVVIGLIGFALAQIDNQIYTYHTQVYPNVLKLTAQGSVGSPGIKAAG